MTTQNVANSDSTPSVMARGIGTTYGLYIDMAYVAEVCIPMRLVGANRHVDILIKNGDKRVEMSLDEFIERLGV